MGSLAIGKLRAMLDAGVQAAADHPALFSIYLVLLGAAVAMALVLIWRRQPQRALWCVAGTPGADNQVQINFQIATAMIDFGLDPQQAAEMPRWTSMVPGQYANYPHDGPDVLTMERRFPENVRRELARRGHPVDTVGDLDGPCSVEIIRRDAESGMLLAGSDPRRDGWALAW